MLTAASICAYPAGLVYLIGNIAEIDFGVTDCNPAPRAVSFDLSLGVFSSTDFLSAEVAFIRPRTFFRKIIELRSIVPAEAGATTARISVRLPIGGKGWDECSRRTALGQVGLKPSAS